VNKNVFIFVVCGTKEHIDTLHFSLKYLKKYSKNEIWILTDSSRNETDVVHQYIIDIETPKEFNHHQASIFLKTGIHKFVPKGNNYCYLDTDVIALCSDVDTIFEQYLAPIRFAGDSITIDYFSPYALNCNCLEKYISNEQYLKVTLAEIEERVERSKISSGYWRRRMLYLLPFRYYHLDSEFYLEKETETWYLKNGTPLTLENIHKEHNGKNKCSHLRDLLLSENQDFKIDESWQHWNGGVFLFNDESHPFLDTWHQLTLASFEDTYWKTRDQGTLIKTIWKFGLQNHPRLEKKWNFLADSNNPLINCDQFGNFTGDGWRTKLNVNFVHVYHRFGDTNWHIWNNIINNI
jgi:hypothetical protein